ncbi:membrane protein insertion efficiency factor YidD [Candidatus Roizmanbacteria bacterium RIFCSPHIGHO2_01_FULL_39_8]|uniref:Putative membrane protein insertion efficiency factor n=3 Tax=Candidatus Roizmaniibacteriota TaxID=1752723 RepID=A0A1F7GPT4_9BACT|nr:MAG: membrane protein insertion efficiency factor YidD [Candidatus Roizmanbacteria bacterium RIFCSPHIGHO2_01_FULL_39_8]OGK25637.1 MAG: membrane protein insertion efficiency factor YidD [Candidatus Roizmanbacteria bacterium RIFCSPHIGHO2_02_FULL_39_9]OGK35270.1 MAG: membrane protein insertion efficiency factor YidD [Candidatus Roizmanbacteria bacterium RIFCSPHIGHO2_12_FULL_39_8]
MKRLILAFIRFYKRTEFFHGHILRTLFMTDRICRFEPTCSEYTYQAVDTYGTIKGLWLGFKRIIRCHPWNKGGIDPLP